MRELRTDDKGVQHPPGHLFSLSVGAGTFFPYFLPFDGKQVSPGGLPDLFFDAEYLFRCNRDQGCGSALPDVLPDIRSIDAAAIKEQRACSNDFGPAALCVFLKMKVEKLSVTASKTRWHSASIGSKKDISGNRQVALNRHAAQRVCAAVWLSHVHPTGGIVRPQKFSRFRIDRVQKDPF